jgi:alpha-D-ribose 1-methylphosphonate 5-triphosphate synthase subunit PhnG
MSVLAKASAAEIETAWNSLPERAAYRCVRPAEIGLVMTRGRICGSGGAFNLGEITVTRCVVELESGGAWGFSYVAGRDLRHAERAAAFDAVLQQGENEAAREAIDGLAAAWEKRRRIAAGEAAATKVDFFTMVRE